MTSSCYICDSNYTDDQVYIINKIKICYLCVHSFKLAENDLMDIDPPLDISDEVIVPEFKLDDLFAGDPPEEIK